MLKYGALDLNMKSAILLVQVVWAGSPVFVLTPPYPAGHRPTKFASRLVGYFSASKGNVKMGTSQHRLLHPGGDK